MSVLDALDATKICTRWSPSLDDPSVWALSSPAPTRRPLAAVPEPYSWWSLARNSRALLVTGMVGTVLVKDAAVSLVGTLTGAR